MNKRKVRDLGRLLIAIVFSWLYIPHLLVYRCLMEGGKIIDSDLKRHAHQVNIKLPIWLLLIYMLHNNRYYRNLFYFRIGPIWSMLIGWYRPGDKYFTFSKVMKIGEGFLMAHPYSTMLNAKSIGKNFSCLHMTTLGKTDKGMPTIGDNVTLGTHVCVIGPVHIGNNVKIGAGSVVVTDIPDNSVAIGVPAKIIKKLQPIE